MWNEERPSCGMGVYGGGDGREVVRLGLYRLVIIGEEDDEDEDVGGRMVVGFL